MGKTILMVTHDPRIARQTDRIYRIMDGKIVSIQRPSESEESNVEIMLQMYKDRLQETNDELDDIMQMFKEQRIDPDNFAERWHNLHQTKTFLELELHRMGF